MNAIFLPSAIVPFDVVVVAVAFHSTGHCVVLIATTPALRSKILEVSLEIIYLPKIHQTAR